MTDNYYIPQKTTAPVDVSVSASVPQQVNHAALRQTVQEAVRAAVPNISTYTGDVRLYITVHIHL